MRIEDPISAARMADVPIKCADRMEARA